MKDTKVKRIRQKIAMLKQSSYGATLARSISCLATERFQRSRTNWWSHIASASIPRWTRYDCSWGKSCLLTVLAKTWWVAACQSELHMANP